MVENYREEGMVCGNEDQEIRHYYLWGSKKVPYRSIKGVQRVALAALKGRARIWGTANPATGPTSIRSDRPRKRAWPSTSVRASSRSSRQVNSTKWRRSYANALDSDRPDRRFRLPIFDGETRGRRRVFLRQTRSGRSHCTSCGSELKLVKGVYGHYCPHCGAPQT